MHAALILQLVETCMSFTVGDFALHLGLKGVEKIDHARAPWPVAQLVKHLTRIQRTQARILARSQCLFLTSWPAFSLVADNVFWFGNGLTAGNSHYKCKPHASIYVDHQCLHDDQGNKWPTLTSGL